MAKKSVKKKETSKKTVTENKNTKKKYEKPSLHPVNQILPFIFGLAAAFLLFCYIWPNASGVIGNGTRSVFFGIFGVASIALPVLLVLLAVSWFKLVNSGKAAVRIIFGTLFTVMLSAFCAVFTLSPENKSAAELFKAGGGFSGGGFIGGELAQLMRSGFGSVFTAIISGVLFLVFLGLTLGITPSAIASFINERPKKPKTVKKPVEPKPKRPAVEETVTVPAETAAQPSKKTKKELYDYEKENIRPPEEPDELTRLLEDEGGVEQFEKTPAEMFFEDDVPLENIERLKPETAKTEDKPKDPVPAAADGKDEEEEEEEPVLEVKTESIGKAKAEPPKKAEKTEENKTVKEYKLPPITLLSTNKGEDRINRDELRENGRKIIDTLENFGVSATIENISYGPTITRYELMPANGVRISRISALIDDIRRVLKVKGVRFESSIEGEATVGIEVPNKNPLTVRIRTLIDSDEFRNSPSKVNCALGIDISNKPVFLDIKTTPHLLISGATGTGKSVCINSLIMSILYKAKPDEVKLILIDPKKLEFAPYAGIPHLLVPVITDMKKAAGALSWLVQEMERRYTLIEKTGCRKIEGYNREAEKDPELEKLPLIVIIIDELADLMIQSRDTVEESINRIAAKARAAGMHLIVGTQRPSVDVLTGTIKNNIPVRIACKVSSQVDSRTIIDEAGAEKLIGRGDMLYKSSTDLTRLQGAFTSEEEVDAVVEFIKSQSAGANYNESIIKDIEEEAKNIKTKDKMSSGNFGENEDEMLLPAIDISFNNGRVSTSLLGRKLSIGYGRAAKIIDRMYEMGICSGENGSKPRDLIITREEFEAKFLNSGVGDDEEE